MTTNACGSTKEEVLVVDYINYKIIVGYSHNAKQDMFQIINKRWNVVAWESPSEEQVKEIGKMLDELYGKSAQEIDTTVQNKLTMSH